MVNQGATMAPDPMGSDGNHQHPGLSSLAELGFQVRVLDRFCVVTEVQESTPAADSGLESGDMIEQINGVPVKEGMDFQAGAMMALQEGKIRFRVLKGTGIFEEIDVARPQNGECVLLSQVGLWVKREEGKLVIARILQKSPAAYCGKCAIGDVLEAVAYTRPYSLAELCEVAWGTVGTLLQIEMREGGGGPISTVHLLRQSPSESNLKIAGSFTDETEKAAVGVHVRFSEGEFLVSVIEDGSPAYWSDLKVGDKISKIDGERLRDVDQFVVQSLGLAGTRLTIMVKNKNGPASSVMLVRAPTLHGDALARAKEYRNQALDVLQQRIQFSLAKTPTKPAQSTAVGVPTPPTSRAPLEEELLIVSAGASPRPLSAHRTDEDAIVAVGPTLSADRSGSPTHWHAPETFGALQDPSSVPSTVLPALSPPQHRRPASPITAIPRTPSPPRIRTPSPSRIRTPSPPPRQPSPPAAQQGPLASERSAVVVASPAVELVTPQPRLRQSPPRTLEAPHQEMEASPDLIGEMDLILSHQSSRFSSFVEPPIFAASPVPREPATASRHLFKDTDTDVDQSERNATVSSLPLPTRDKRRDLQNPFRNTLPEHPSPPRSWHAARPTHLSPPAPKFPSTGVPISQEWTSPPGESVALLGNSAIAAGHGPSLLLHSDDQPRSIETSVDRSSLQAHFGSPTDHPRASPPPSLDPSVPSGSQNVSFNDSDISPAVPSPVPVLNPTPSQGVQRGRELSPVLSTFLANALDEASERVSPRSRDQARHAENSPSRAVHSDAVLGRQRSPSNTTEPSDTTIIWPGQEHSREENTRLEANDAGHSYLVAVEEEEEEEEISPVQYKLTSSLNQEDEGDIEMSPPIQFRSAPQPFEDAGASPSGTTMQKNASSERTENVKSCLEELGLEDYAEFSANMVMQDVRKAPGGSRSDEAKAGDEDTQKAALATMAVAILTAIHSSSKAAVREIMRLLPDKPGAAAEMAVKVLQESARPPPSNPSIGRVQVEIAFDPTRFRPNSSEEEDVVQSAAFLPLDIGDAVEVMSCGTRGWAFGSKVTAQGVKTGWFPWDFVSSDSKIDEETFKGRHASRHSSDKTRAQLDEVVIDSDSEQDTASNLRSDLVAVALCGWEAHKPWARSLVAGQTVHVLKRAHGWVYVAEANPAGPDQIEGKRGWVPGRFLGAMDDSSTPAAASSSHAAAQLEGASSAIDRVDAPRDASSSPSQPSSRTKREPSSPSAQAQAVRQNPTMRKAPVPNLRNSHSLSKVFSRGATPHQQPSTSSQPEPLSNQKPSASESQQKPAEAGRKAPDNEDVQALGTVLNVGKSRWRKVDADSPAEQRFRWTQRFSRLGMTPRVEEVQSTVSPPEASLSASRSGATRRDSSGMTKEQAWALLGQGFVDTESDEKLLYA